MTLDELKAQHAEAYKIIQRERKMRLYVFAKKPEMLRAKIAEMDRLLKILSDWKDVLKSHCEPEIEQPKLLDVPRKYD
jgi:hypothetical protein